MVKRAIIAGASGLIGNTLLNILLRSDRYTEVLMLVRKELPVKHPKLKQLIVNFDEPEKYQTQITGDVVFSCLGSTQKKTPDLKEYRKIDHDYALDLAKIALKNKVAQFHFVSSIGADAGSSNFYTRMKGETEDDLIEVGLPSLHIFRPGVLTGERKESRLLESIIVAMMKVIDPLLIGKLKKYRSIAASAVAQAMYNQSLKDGTGIHIYSSDKIQELS